MHFDFFVAAAVAAVAAFAAFAAFAVVVVVSFAAVAVVKDRVVVVVIAAAVEQTFFEELEEEARHSFFEECDLLVVVVRLVHPWSQDPTDLTFVVLRRIMLRYYSLFIIYNFNKILFLYYFRIFILIVSWHI